MWKLKECFKQQLKAGERGDWFGQAGIEELQKLVLKGSTMSTTIKKSQTAKTC